MCGIFGAVNGESVVGDLMAGLRRLEYRGYDSAGIAVSKPRRIESRKAEGKLANLGAMLKTAPLDGRVGIAHTRWATHGVPSVANAHPHGTELVAVVHNGIIENFRELRAELTAQGHVFESETDTEVVPRLITSFIDAGLDADVATTEALKRLRGAYALGILYRGEESRMIAARRGSPLVVGLGEHANFVASDALALAGAAPEVVYLEDGDWAEVEQDRVRVHDTTGRVVERPARRAAHTSVAVGKGGFRHYMEKEIHEQPLVLRHTLAAGARLGLDWTDVPRLSIIACGTSCHAGQVARYWFERHAGLPTEVDTASEFRYRAPLMAPGGVALFISQSGETADTLAAMRHARSLGQTTVALVNVAESSMAREADLVLTTKAGPEIGVASTKAFTTQLAALASMVIEAGIDRGGLDDAASLAESLAGVPGRIEAMLEDDASVRAAARAIAKARSAIFIGRGTAFPIALEGALKLKEISYIHAEGFGAGELKHGPIALIDDNVPVIVVAPNDGVFDKTVSNLREVGARGGRLFVISDRAGVEACADDVEGAIEIPESDPFVAPILCSIPLQLLAYHVAVAKGTDVDQPRNLAKSVTVE